MPHDCNGKLLKVDDKVIVRAKVTQVYPQEDYCNVQLETDLPMKPSDSKSGMTLNASQVEKVEE